MSDLHANNDIGNQQPGRGVSEPWTEWFTVEGGASSVSVAHYRAIRVRRLVDLENMDMRWIGSHEAESIANAEFPVWLIWSERKVMTNWWWRFEGSFKELPNGTYYLTFSTARIAQIEKLGEWYESACRLADAAQAALNEARDWKGHECAPMPPIGKIGEFDLSDVGHRP